VVSCPATPAARWRGPARSARIAPSLVRATLRRNGAAALTRDAVVEVALASRSRIVTDNGSRLWCVRYPGLAGLFRKDRGPSKELGRALCDEVMDRFACGGFMTTDELPRYGIGRMDRRTILAAAGAGPRDCVIVYAHPPELARAVDEYVHGRLVSML
jgi:Glu-tRNA(Gln) amidotransferase subunit E-like FAD-binding protein